MAPALLYPENGEVAGFGAVCCAAAEIFLCRDGQGARGERPGHPEGHTFRVSCGLAENS